MFVCASPLVFSASDRASLSDTLLPASVSVFLYIVGLLKVSPKTSFSDCVRTACLPLCTARQSNAANANNAPNSAEQNIT